MDVETRPLVIDLALAHVPEPTVGEEVAGIPIEIAWTRPQDHHHKRFDAEERADLVSAGWTVCEPDAEAIKAALQNGEG